MERLMSVNPSFTSDSGLSSIVGVSTLASGGGLSTSGATSGTSGFFSSRPICSWGKIKRTFMQMQPPGAGSEAGSDAIVRCEHGPPACAWPPLALCSPWLAFWLSPPRPSSCSLRPRPWPCSQNVLSAFQHLCSLRMTDKL